MEDAATLALRDRLEGRSPTGTVCLRDFDQGVVTTMGAQLAYNDQGQARNYYLDVPGVRGRIGREGIPGVPIVFAFPEDVFEKYDFPLIVCRRDDITPTMNRWHPGLVQYRAPAGTGSAAVVNSNPGNPGAEDLTGFNKVEELQQAAPYDISYTISIFGRNRGGGTNQANAILKTILRVYQPYSLVHVIDSIGDGRTYEAFQESISHLDEVPEVVDRVIGFAVTLRVEAELDLLDPETKNTVTALPTITTQQIGGM
jgi:hypothetical protein